MSINPLPDARLNWRRVGALSASFNLHGVAIVLALLAMLAPPTVPEPMQRTDDVLIAEIVEPAPIPPPPLPMAAQPPARALPPAAPRPRTVIEQATMSEPAPAVADSLPETQVSEPTQAPIRVEAPAPASHGAAAYAAVDAPAYPPIARRQGREGETLLRVLVGVDGRPLTILIGRSSGHRDLDRAARLAVREWRFRAAMEGGVAIESWVEVPIAFSLDRG
jgi:protein TonB